MMFTRYRFQRNAIVIWILLGLVLSAPAIADDTNAPRGAVPQTIFNLDLCTLAYQFYHQSLCLPLDPWYDMMSRVGSDRRNNICRFTHDYSANLGLEHGFYSGPNAARGWRESNLNLDPILTNYKHIDTTSPAFTRDGERFLAVVAPSYVTRNIKTVEGIRYRTKPTSYPYNDVELFRIRETPSGDDHLIVFEGGTGSDGKSDPSWSLMGFVLMHKTQTGYDAHIVFRGSRSGASLAKTVWRAQDAIGAHKGNPDWITDLRGTTQIDLPLISKVGKVTEGFGESLPTMLGTITACCKYLEQKYPAPEHIYVTGHSLGAGLASQFVSSVIQGSYGDVLRNEVRGWDWGKTTLVAFAQPIPGDPSFAANFDKLSPSSQHYWVAGDAVVEATSSTIVGLFIDKGEHCGIQKKLSPVANCNDNVHEVFVIRNALVRDLSSVDAPLSQQLGQENSWAYYSSVLKMLAGQPESYVYPGAPAPRIITEENLKRVLQNYNFGPEFDRWLEQVYARMIVDKSSYIGPKFQSTLDERRNLVIDIAQRMRTASSGDNAADLDGLVKESELIDGNLGLTNEEQWIYCAAILSRLQKTNLTLSELLSKPVIRTCLDSKFDE
jgi:hypothetical protein